MSADGTPLGERTWVDPILSAPPGGVGFENILLSQTRAVDSDGDGSLELWATQTVPDFWYHIFDFDSALGMPKSTGLAFPADVLAAGNDVYLEAIHFGDFDGDGLADLLHQDYVDENTPYWNIYKNTGGSFDVGNAILPDVKAYCGRTSRLLDNNGDGRVEVWSASTHGCGESVTMGLGTSGEVQVEELKGLGYEAKVSLWADLNGDGLRDIVRPRTPTAHVRFNTGLGYGPKEDLVDGPYPDPNAHEDMDQGTHVVDINGDGLEDILAFRYAPSPKILVYLSRGDGSFNVVDLAVWPGMFHAFEGFTTSKPGDFNGDGLVDIVLVGADNHVRVLVQKPGQVDKVVAIWDDLFAEHPREVIHYTNQGSDSSEPAACSFPQRCFRHGVPVVREHWTWQGEDVGQYRKIRYAYEDPRVDLQGRGFLGFGKVRVWDADRLSETTTTFDHETRFGSIYPYAGLPASVTHVAPIFETLPAPLPAFARARVTRVDNNYALNLLNQWKTHVVHPSTWSSLEWEQDVLIRPDAIELASGPHPEILRRRSGSYAFDTYGNLTKAEEQTEGGVYRKVERTYDIRPNDWLISLPQSVAFTSARSGAGPPPAPRVTHYENDAKGFLKRVKVEPTSLEPHQRLTTTFHRNGDGLVDAITLEAPGEKPRHVYVSYAGEEGIFPQHVWGDLGFVGGLALGFIGGGGEVLGVSLSVTGIGAIAGVPAMAGSAVLLTGAISNIAAGTEGLVRALSTGSGSSSGASAGTATTTGQEHHIISRTIHKRLEMHPTLKGKYTARDPRFVSRAADKPAHNGYQQWHRKIEEEAIEWLDNNPSATTTEFEAFLRQIYSRPDMKGRFPNGF